MEKSKKEKRAKSLLQSKKSDYSKTKEDMEEKRKKERVKNKESVAQQRREKIILIRAIKGAKLVKSLNQNGKVIQLEGQEEESEMSKALKEREKRRVIQEERKNNKVKKGKIEKDAIIKRFQFPKRLRVRARAKRRLLLI